MPNDARILDADRIASDVSQRIDWLIARGQNALDAPVYAPPVWSAPGGPRAALAALFELNPSELALLDVCIAVHLTSTLESALCELQGWPRRPLPTEALVRAAYDLPPGAIWRPTSPLARWRLVQRIADPSGAAPSYRVDPAIADWMSGKATLDAGLVGICRIPSAQKCSPDWDVAAQLRAIDALGSRQDNAIRLHVMGSQGTGRAEYARKIALARGRDTLEIDGALMAPDTIADTYICAQRFAVLTGRVPVWRSVPAVWPGHLACAGFQIVTVEDRARAPRDHVATREVCQPELTRQQRDKIWHDITGKELPLALARATLGELRQTAPLAQAPGAVEAAIQDRALTDLAEIGRVVTPALAWDDLIVPPHIRASLVDYTTEARLYAHQSTDPAFRRLFAKDGAPTALFSGPPGVGKTMAAECIAADLALPLLVIDVSRTVSKYIGDTAKNLSRIFDEARRFGCILFFDEADAYFGKRTEVKDSHDRHANADTGHLLQLIENYEGMVILGTNKRGHIDEAFLRRIRHSVDFPKPTRIERRRIWVMLAGHLFAECDVSAARQELETIADRFELSPAQIKAAVLTASYECQRSDRALERAILLSAVARELRKEGRSLPSDLVQATTIVKEVSDVA